VGNCITYVVNKHSEEERAQDRSLRDTGEKFKWRGKNTRKADLKFLVGYVTAKPVYIATKEAQKH
jgi:hypothetical protein